MKIKLHLVITDPDKFMCGGYNLAFSLYTKPMDIDAWINCGEVEFEIDADVDEMKAKAKAALDGSIKYHKTELARKRAELRKLS